MQARSNPRSKTNITGEGGGGVQQVGQTKVPTPPPSPVVDIRSLRWHGNCDGKENIKAVGLISRISTLHIHHIFWVHFFMISRFMEDVNTQRQILNLHGTGPAAVQLRNWLQPRSQDLSPRGNEVEIDCWRIHLQLKYLASWSSKEPEFTSLTL